MTRGCVCVFAKPPRPGAAKTRLAPVLGDAGAAALAAAFLRDIWAMGASLPWADLALATTEVEAPEWAALGAITIWDQGAGSLGDRLERMLRRGLERHPFAIAIGADLPGLPASRLEAAREALQRREAVVGPAEDGGFYLLGLTRCPDGLLDQVPWSAADTCAKTLERLALHHVPTEIIDAWFDVDEPADLQTLRARLDSGAIVAPETFGVLQRLSAGPLTAREQR